MVIASKLTVFLELRSQRLSILQYSVTCTLGPFRVLAKSMCNLCTEIRTNLPTKHLQKAVFCPWMQASVLATILFAFLGSLMSVNVASTGKKPKILKTCRNFN